MSEEEGGNIITLRGGAPEPDTDRDIAAYITSKLADFREAKGEPAHALVFVLMDKTGRTSIVGHKINGTEEGMADLYVAQASVYLADASK